MKRTIPRTRKDRTLTGGILRQNPKLTVIYEQSSGQFAIYDTESKEIIGDDRWTFRRDAEQYLAVSLIFASRHTKKEE